MTLLGLLVLLLGLLLLLLVLLLMVVGLESAQHEYGISNEQDLNIRFQTYCSTITVYKYKQIEIQQSRYSDPLLLTGLLQRCSAASGHLA